MTIKLLGSDKFRVKIFNALGESKRIEIIRYLYQYQKVCTCTDIGELFNLNKSNGSYHLKILSEADLITITRDGQFKNIEIKKETFQKFIPGFLDTL